MSVDRGARHLCGYIHKSHKMQVPKTSSRTMHSVFQLCRRDRWNKVLAMVEASPEIALKPMTMDNHISTTIVHQAITSKADIPMRAKVIMSILQHTPQAASIRNGYGSLPLHVIAQRNTKMDSQTKERLIYMLIGAYPGALTQEGGVGKRTPLHIAFTDYISPQLAFNMIRKGIPATRMRDRKGWLPIHVACSRHCSPEKLRMLLGAFPGSLYVETDEGQSLMDLAKTTATKTHPNIALLAELGKQMANGTHNLVDFTSSANYTPTNASSGVAALQRDDHSVWPRIVTNEKRQGPSSSTRRRATRGRASERRLTEEAAQTAAANLLLHFSHASADEGTQSAALLQPEVCTSTMGEGATFGRVAQV